FLDLRDALTAIKGRFLMTINDVPEIREMFKQFNIEEVKLKYSCCSSSKARSKPRTELLISN
ncbi:MAG: DNA adenine methylase, partial [Desulfobulbus propionicus]